MLPAMPDLKRADRFAWITRGLAIGPIALFAGWLLVGQIRTSVISQPSAMALVGAPLLIVMASVACELAIAWALSRTVEARGVPPRRQFAFWRALCSCFSSYLILTCWACTVVACIHFAGLLLGLLIVAWWSSQLGYAIAARVTTPGRGRLARVLVPIIGVAVYIPCWVAAQFWILLFGLMPLK
jgi:hypothetical protein